MPPSSSDTRPVVLLVEDEPLVRLFNADIFDDEGFRVIEGSNADEALALFVARPDINLLVTDIEMPGSMNGLGLARRIREQRPQVAIVIISGRVRPDLAELPVQSRFVSKPYAPAVLLREAHEAMNALHRSRF